MQKKSKKALNMSNINVYIAYHKHIHVVQKRYVKRGIQQLSKSVN